MPIYSCAYKLESLRKYPKWDQVASDAHQALEDDAVVFVKEDFVVTTNGVDQNNEDDFLVANVDEAWKTFCTEELGFKVPDWEAESARVREMLKKEEAEA